MPTRALHGPLYKPVPPFLRQLRTHAGMTQRDLAAAVGRPQSWVQKCEAAERRVDVAEFVLWCAGCKTDPSDALARLGGLLPAVADAAREKRSGRSAR